METFFVFFPARLLFSYQIIRASEYSLGDQFESNTKVNKETLHSLPQGLWFHFQFCPYLCLFTKPFHALFFCIELNLLTLVVFYVLVMRWCRCFFQSVLGYYHISSVLDFMNYKIVEWWFFFNPVLYDCTLLGSILVFRFANCYDLQLLCNWPQGTKVLFLHS